MAVSRRRAIGAGASLLMTGFARGAFAKDYPSKPIRIIVANPPGSGLDADTRFWAAALTSILGQSVIVDNRPGGATTIGTSLAAKAPPDGYTLLMGIPSSLCYMSELYTHLPYKPSDFDAISQLTTLRSVLVAHPSLPVSNATELVALAKAQPGSINVGTVGVGTFQHLLGEWFGAITGTTYKFVPYNTTSPYTALLGGETQVMFDGLPASMSNIRAGKLKALAVTGKSRHPLLPTVPTFQELGFTDYDASTWFGLLAPAGTPKPILEKLASACATVARRPEVIQRYQEYGGEPVGSTPAEFSAYIQAERAKWVPVVRRSGIKLELTS
ncbi:Bug family tripartite tricarboxylate transporter substrate binding protein [Variovorax ginsengisoli]|uniref:Tripartite tricarboxylate transporter substrate binding protein n=1 Tax=Variovorax ginsengisoli TaxID=363844 RepID=A0ABT8SGI7_9BURK|nr:tripartite tricarboxylate transporter substrate binding protein [Variovorax ginsengisoli]MDN8618832.1 tripartite tricarboxylate transporter substrate binding protein [Variovorax ginsengisoli]MDO1538002.1 tripartite tricarboxylate transporter substrate binding protein [Variovorax ginsengisoli]